MDNSVERLQDIAEDDGKHVGSRSDSEQHAGGTRFPILSVVCLAFLSGCASYVPKPLTQDAINHALKTPGNAEIRIRISSIIHPILKPILFDNNDGLSPDEAAVFAVVANPRLRAARDARGLAAAQLLQAGILPNPQISLGFDAPVGSGVSGKHTGIGIGLDWEATSLLTRRSRKDAARSHALSVDMGIAWQEWQIAESAKLNVYRLAFAEQRLTLMENAKRIAGQACQIAKTSVAEGIATAPRLLAAKTALRKVETDIINAQSDVKTIRLELKRDLGLPADAPVKIEEPVSPITVDTIPSAQELTDGLAERRLDLIALRYGYDSQQARLRTAIRSQLPRIGLGLTGAEDTDGLQTIGLGITISLPVFNRNQGHIAIERADRRQLFDEYTSRLFEARADVAHILAKLHATANQLELAKKTGKALREEAAWYEKSAADGLSTVFDSTYAELRLNAQELKTLALRRKLSELAVALEIASGRYLSTDKAPSSPKHPPIANNPEASK